MKKRNTAAEKKAARDCAHKALALADDIQESARIVLRSLRRNDEHWDAAYSMLVVQLEHFAPTLQNHEEAQADAVDADTEEA